MIFTRKKTDKKVVIITGASSGIGYYTAKLLNKDEYIVYGTTRSNVNFKKLKDIDVNPIKIDLENYKEIDKFIKNIYQKHGKIDVLVNNAGFGNYGPMELMDITELKQLYEINVFSLIYMAQQVIPFMKKQRDGKIINIASIAGKFSFFMGGAYHSSKYSVEAISESLYLELRQFNIKVVCIEPGIIKTPWIDTAMQHLQKYSRDCDYQYCVDRTQQSFTRLYSSRFATEPLKVAEVINRAINSDNPRFKQAVGFGSKEMLLLKKITPDNIYYPMMYRIIMGMDKK